MQDRGKGIRWRNTFFVMESSTSKVRINFEHTRFRWVKYGALARYADLLGAFEDKDVIIREVGKRSIRR